MIVTLYEQHLDPQVDEEGNEIEDAEETLVIENIERIEDSEHKITGTIHSAVSNDIKEYLFVVDKGNFYKIQMNSPKKEITVYEE